MTFAEEHKHFIYEETRHHLTLLGKVDYVRRGRDLLILKTWNPHIGINPVRLSCYNYSDKQKKMAWLDYTPAVLDNDLIPISEEEFERRLVLEDM